MAKFPFYNPKAKRLEKLSSKDQEDLVFDLINAFALAKNPLDTALLLQDLLTASEIKNLSKRLRIAKLLLKDYTHKEIVDELHCSYGTITKVNLWLQESGEGLRKIIKNLPKRRKMAKARKMGSFGYGLPQILIVTYLNSLEEKERRRIRKFLENVGDKKLLYKKLQEVIDEEFREMTSAKKIKRIRQQGLKKKEKL